MAGKSKAREKLEYEAVLSAEDAARYFERLAAGMREHVMLVESGDSSVALDVSSNVKIELEVNADRKQSSIDVEVTWRPEDGEIISRPGLRVVPGDTGNLLDDGDYEDAYSAYSESGGVPDAQLPLPEEPPPWERQQGTRQLQSDLAEAAVDDMRAYDIETPLDAYAGSDDVFAEAGEAAFEPGEQP
jgi:amphi-Trp domain-containing protein